MYICIHNITITKPVFTNQTAGKQNRCLTWLQQMFAYSAGHMLTITVSFHNFKSQEFKLSVSNPKGKYVAYLSVLSQVSICQSLGRKNKHEMLKTDRDILRSKNG